MEDFDTLLTDNSPEAQALARALRTLVRRLVPRAREKIFPGWGVADYGFPLRSAPGASGGEFGRGFLSIGPQKTRVNLYFMDGVALPDPAGLLEGAGKRLRHVKLRSPEELKNPALHALIRQAAAATKPGKGTK